MFFVKLAAVCWQPTGPKDGSLDNPDIKQGCFLSNLQLYVGIAKRNLLSKDRALGTAALEVTQMSRRFERPGEHSFPSAFAWEVEEKFSLCLCSKVLDTPQKWTWYNTKYDLNLELFIEICFVGAFQNWPVITLCDFIYYINMNISCTMEALYHHRRKIMMILIASAAIFLATCNTYISSFSIYTGYCVLSWYVWSCHVYSCTV